IWSSVAIEGNTLDKYETAVLLERGLKGNLHGKTLKESLEILDLNEAYNYMMSLAIKKKSITAAVIRNLNRLSTLNTMQPKTDAGKYRVIDVWPSGSTKNPYASPLDIISKMEQLIEWSQIAQKQLHPVQYATDLHQKFVTIHPFRDGNGRTGRLLMNMILTESGYPIININPAKEARTHYIEALDQSHYGEKEHFRDLILNYTNKELDRIISILQLNDCN
ncbi:Fic family protein, partial [Lactobacillus sp. XV13L]|nr:Fic family protein [Lactobacillus sp. XV13L]